jgi:hypothetical protein
MGLDHFRTALLGAEAVLKKKKLGAEAKPLKANSSCAHRRRCRAQLSVATCETLLAEKEQNKFNDLLSEKIATMAR